VANAMLATNITFMIESANLADTQGTDNKQAKPNVLGANRACGTQSRPLRYSQGPDMLVIVME
jgi:UDP-glucose 6-dehydrogenase